MNEQEREKEATRVMSSIKEMNGYGDSFLSCPLCPIDHLFDVLTLEAHIANQHLNCGSFKCTCKQVLFTFPHMQEHIKMHKAKGEEHECRLRMSNKDAFIRNSEIPKIVGIAIQNLVSKQGQRRPDKRTIGVQHQPQICEKATQKKAPKPKSKKEASQQTDLVIRIPKIKSISTATCQTEPSCSQKTTVSTSSATTQTRRKKQATVETQTRTRRSRCIKTQTSSRETVERMTSPIPYRIPKKRAEVTEPKKLFWNEGQQPASVGLRAPLPLSPTSLPSVDSSGSNELYEPTSPKIYEPIRSQPLEPSNKRPAQPSAPVPRAPPVIAQSTNPLRGDEPPRKAVKMFTTFLSKKATEAKPMVEGQQPDTTSKSSTNCQQKGSSQQNEQVQPEPDTTIGKDTEQTARNDRIVLNIKREPAEEMPPPTSPEPCATPTVAQQADHLMEEAPYTVGSSNTEPLNMDVETDEAEAREDGEKDGPSRFVRGKTPNPSMDRMLSRLEAFNPTNNIPGPKRRMDRSPTRRHSRRSPSPRRRRRTPSSSSSSHSRSRSPIRRTPSPEISEEERRRRALEEALRQIKLELAKEKTAKTETVPPVAPNMASATAVLRPTGFEPTEVLIPYSLEYWYSLPYRKPAKIFPPPPPIANYPSLPVANQPVNNRSTTKEALQMSKKCVIDPQELKRMNVLANRLIKPSCPFDPEELARRCQMVKEASTENISTSSSEPPLPKPDDQLIPPPPPEPPILK